MYQYKIKVNDAEGPILSQSTADEKWYKCEVFWANRGGYFALSRRRVETTPFEGGTKVGTNYISPWTIYAELES